MSTIIYAASNVRTLKPYKLKRLFFSKYFGNLWNTDSTLTQLQHEFKICTHCWLIRLTASDIETVMAWWYARHGIRGNFHYLRDGIIPETYQQTLQTVKAEKKAENQRAKERRAKLSETSAVGKAA